MYSLKDRKRAVDLYIKYDLSTADTIRELGYPNRNTLIRWHKEFIDNGYLHGCYARRSGKYTEQQKKDAVNYYLEHGRSLARTVRKIGYPTKEALRLWIDELAPSQRKVFKGMLRSGKPSPTFEQKKSAVIDLCSRKGSAKGIADAHGVTRATLYQWKYRLLGREEMPMRPDENRPLSDSPDILRQQIADLQKESKELKRDNHRLRMENDILVAAAEVLKKDQGIDPRLLTNREKAMVIDALRPMYPLNDLFDSLAIAKSSYFYQRNALSAPDKYADARARIREIFKANKGVYGYRRIWGDLGNGGTRLSEKVVRRIMAEDGLIVIIKRRRRYSSYKGEISPEVENLVQRNFHADAPNRLWLTDITEFHIPAGKVYLSPLLDCFDGMLVSWTISTNPNAELVNTMLDLAIGTLGDDEHPVLHSDRGCHYRWPGWIERMEAANLTRSMSKKGCSPDNSACEGLFGRIKNEMFYNRSWAGVSIEEFAAAVNDYLYWYNEKRIKQTLGYLSPQQYRQSLGLAA